MKNSQIKFDQALLKLAEKVGITAIDVGARGGVNTDLLPLASAVDFVGFEPDPVECETLNQKPSTAWKSTHYLPYALSDFEKKLNLNLYSKAGCTSCYRAIPERGALFSRGHYFQHVGNVEISSVCLDDLVVQGALTSPDFMKIDVQGMEVDVFKGACGVFDSSLVGIRTEVSFFELYKDQPLFAEIDTYLRTRGFVAMRFIEMHDWRRLTSSKREDAKNCEIAHSNGQLMHGDVLYLRHPEDLETATEGGIIRLIRLALVAACYGHFDHAHAIFSRAKIKDYCQESGFDALASLLKTAAHESRWSQRLLRSMKRMVNKIG